MILTNDIFKEHPQERTTCLYKNKQTKKYVMYHNIKLELRAGFEPTSASLQERASPAKFTEHKTINQQELVGDTGVEPVFLGNRPSFFPLEESPIEIGGHREISTPLTTPINWLERRDSNPHI